ncbi:MAG: FAD:protein FMN transferase [Lachnospiraceae bacterium]|nr:FAD:protein FMN transferase [Lachnospiraceae bacterium]
MSRRTKSILLGALAACILLGYVLYVLFGKERAEAKKEYETTIFAMDTVMQIKAYGKHGQEGVDAAVAEINRLENLLSAERDDSDVSKLNREGSAEVSEEVRELIGVAQEVYEETGGAFDVTIYPLMKLWGFPQKEYQVPAQEEIDVVLPLVDASKIKVNEDTVTLGENQQIDLGGIGKGFASQRAMEIFREKGVTSGIVSLGGNIQVLGTKPDGTDYKIGVRDPQTGEANIVLSVHDCCVITSGGYERLFEAAGKTYIHILDPKTGYPVDNSLASVTIVAESGTKADALSTALFVLGYEEGVSIWKAHASEFQAIWIEDDGSVTITEGLKDIISYSGGSFTVVGSD